MGVTVDGQLALAGEDMNDRRSSRGVLRKLLAGGEGEEQELDVPSFDSVWLRLPRAGVGPSLARSAKYV